MNPFPSFDSIEADSYPLHPMPFWDEQNSSLTPSPGSDLDVSSKNNYFTAASGTTAFQFGYDSYPAPDLDTTTAASEEADGEDREVTPGKAQSTKRQHRGPGPVVSSSSRFTESPASTTKLQGAPRKKKTSTSTTTTTTTSSNSSASSDDESAEVDKARASHNVIERNYRRRLNNGFSRLLTVVKASSSTADDDNGRFSGNGNTQRSWGKTDILNLARERLITMRTENEILKKGAQYIQAQHGIVG